MKAVLAVLICSFSAAVIAAPPPAPQVNAAATDVRQLEFTWEPVAGAQSYELWFRSASGAPWAKFGEHDARRSPNWRIAVPVHLLNWAGASYQMKACNIGGCTASNLIGVDGEQLPAMGYFKPQASTGVYAYGSQVALSEDGNTMAVSAGERIGTASNALVVYVYRKTTATSGWRREARLVPQVQRSTWAFNDGDPLSLSGDGNVLALGSFKETGSTVESGAVYLFTRSGGTWSLSQKLTGSGRRTDHFGYQVMLDETARTLVVSHDYPGPLNRAGTLEVYRSSVDGDPFVHDLTIDVPVARPEGTNVCGGASLSGDGNTLVRSCVNETEGYTYVQTGPGFTTTTRLERQGVVRSGQSHDGKVLLVGSRVYRLGSGGWQLETTLGHGDGVSDDVGVRSAISRDGVIAAVGNAGERTLGLGPIYPPYQQGDADSANGGVVVYQHKATGWEVRRLVKPGSASRGDAGAAVALGANGSVLAVGAPSDPSAAAGIDGDRDDTSAPVRGAVWLY